MKPEQSAIDHRLGRAIRTYRAWRGMRQGELAHLVGVSQSQLSLIENAKRNPSLSLLQAITVALGVDMGRLYKMVEKEELD